VDARRAAAVPTAVQVDVAPVDVAPVDVVPVDVVARAVALCTTERE
jgi:hypothetical protein